MSKIELSSISSGYLTAAQLNNNFIAIEDEFNDKVLYRLNPVGEPNQMSNNLDMNSFQILNLPEPVDPNDPLRLQDISSITGDAQQSADDAKQSADAAALSETEAATSASKALVSENNASTSETNAATSETNASTSETNASASEDKAMEWATNPEDDPVETSPDEFSAFHWAQKAEEIVNNTIPDLFLGNTTNPLVDLKLKNTIDFQGVGTPSFTRASGATYVDRYGVVQFSEGGSATNLLLQSQTFDNASWTGFALATADTTVAPDGTLTADTITNSGSAFTSIFQMGLVVVDAENYTLSVHVKNATTDKVSLRMFDGTTNARRVYDLHTGLISIGAGSSGPDPISANIEVLDDNWYRVDLTILVDGTSLEANIYAGDLAVSDLSTIAIWGAQVEQSNFANGYVVTTITSATADVAGKLRFEAEGALLEGASTNVMLHSEELDNAAWTIIGLSVTPNADTAPDGTLTADQIDSLNAQSIYQIASTSFSTTYTFSYWCKLGTKTDNRIAIFDVTNSNFIVASTPTLAVAGIYTRVSVTFTTAANTASVRCYPERGESGSEGSSFVWGAHFEQLGFMSSYIPTVASPVARAADVFSIGGINNIPLQETGTALTVVADFDVIGLVTGLRQRIYEASGAGNLILSLTDSTKDLVFQRTAETLVKSSFPVNTLSRATATVDTSDLVKTYSEGVFTTSATDAPVVPGIVTTLHIGSNNGSSNFLFGHISRLQIDDRTYSDFESSIV